MSVIMSGSPESLRGGYHPHNDTNTNNTAAVAPTFNLAAAKRAVLRRAGESLMDLTLGRYQTIQDDPKLVLEFIEVCKEEVALVLSQLFDAAMLKGQQQAEARLQQHLQNQQLEMGSFNQSVLGGIWAASFRGGTAASLASGRFAKSLVSRSPQRSMRIVDGGTPSLASANGADTPTSPNPRSRLLPDNYYTKTDTQLHDEMQALIQDPESGETIETIRATERKHKERAANEVVETLIRNGAQEAADKKARRLGGARSSSRGNSLPQQPTTNTSMSNINTNNNNPPPLSSFQSPFARIPSASSLASGATSTQQQYDNNTAAAMGNIDDLRQELEVAQHNENFLRSTAREIIQQLDVRDDRILALQGTLSKREIMINEQRRAYICELLHVREMLRQYRETGVCNISDATLYGWDTNSVLESQKEDADKQVSEAVEAAKKLMKAEHDQMESALKRQIEDLTKKVHTLHATLGGGGGLGRAVRGDKEHSQGGGSTSSPISTPRGLFSLARRNAADSKEFGTQTLGTYNAVRYHASFSDDEFLVREKTRMGASGDGDTGSDHGTQQGEDAARGFVDMEDGGVYEDVDTNNVHEAEEKLGLNNTHHANNSRPQSGVLTTKTNSKRDSAKSRTSRPGTAKSSSTRPASAISASSIGPAEDDESSVLAGTNASLLSTTNSRKVPVGTSKGKPAASSKKKAVAAGPPSISPAAAAELRHMLNKKDGEITKLSSEVTGLSERCKGLEGRVADRDKLVRMLKDQIARLVADKAPSASRTPAGLQYHTRKSSLRSMTSGDTLDSRPTTPTTRLSPTTKPHHRHTRAKSAFDESPRQLEGMPLLGFPARGESPDAVPPKEESSTSGTPLRAAAGSGDSTTTSTGAGGVSRASVDEGLMSVQDFEVALKHKEERMDRFAQEAAAGSPNASTNFLMAAPSASADTTRTIATLNLEALKAISPGKTSPATNNSPTTSTKVVPSNVNDVTPGRGGAKGEKGVAVPRRTTIDDDVKELFSTTSLPSVGGSSSVVSRSGPQRRLSSTATVTQAQQLRRELADLTFKHEELEHRSLRWKEAYDAKERAPLLSAFLDQALMDLYEAVHIAESTEEASRVHKWRMLKESIVYQRINDKFEAEIKEMERSRIVDGMTIRTANEHLDKFQKCYLNKVRKLALEDTMRRNGASDDWDTVLLLARGLAQVVRDPAKYAHLNALAEEAENGPAPAPQLHQPLSGPLRLLKEKELGDRRAEANHRAQRLFVEQSVLDRYSVAAVVKQKGPTDQELRGHGTTTSHRGDGPSLSSLRSRWANQGATQRGRFHTPSSTASATSAMPSNIPNRSLVTMAPPQRGPATTTSYQYTTDAPDGVATVRPSSAFSASPPPSHPPLPAGFGKKGPSSRPHSAVGCYYHHGLEEDRQETPQEAASRKYVLSPSSDPTPSLLDPRASLKAADQRTKMLARRGIVEDPSDMTSVRLGGGDSNTTTERVGVDNVVENDDTAPNTTTTTPLHHTSTMERLSTRPASAITNRSTTNTLSSKHKRPMSAATSHSGGAPSPTNTSSTGFDVGAFRTFNATDKRRTLVGMMRSDQAALAQERQDGAKAAFALRSALSRPASAASVLQTSSVHSSTTNTSRGTRGGGTHSYLSASGGRKTASNNHNNNTTIPIMQEGGNNNSGGGGNNTSSLILGRGATLTSSDEVDAGVYRTKLFGRNEKAYL